MLSHILHKGWADFEMTEYTSKYGTLTIISESSFRGFGESFVTFKTILSVMTAIYWNLTWTQCIWKPALCLYATWIQKTINHLISLIVEGTDQRSPSLSNRVTTTCKWAKLKLGQITCRFMHFAIITPLYRFIWYAHTHTGQTFKCRNAKDEEPGSCMKMIYWSTNSQRTQHAETTNKAKPYSKPALNQQNWKPCCYCR